MPFTVPPVTRSPGAFSTGIGSPVTIDSSIDAVAVDDDAVDRHLFAGPDAQESPTCTSASGTSSSTPSRITPRRLRREAEQLP